MEDYAMAGTLEQIIKPVQDEFSRFEEMYNDAFSTSNAVLKMVYLQLKEAKGKQIRPIMALLAAKAMGGVSDKSFDVVLVLEMLHNASLLHDDVIDEADIRRGAPSVNKTFGNKTAILSGDYLLAQAFGHLADISEPRIITALSQLGKDLSEGEILEMVVSTQSLKDESKYLEVIYKKTAVLFATSLYVGALSSGNVSEDEAQRMREFGNKLGMCFQIKDDIFDYQSDSKIIGKPVGADIREKKITLPLIYAYRNASKEEKREAERRLQTSESVLNDVDVEFFLRFVHANKGIQGAEERMDVFRKEAERLLDSFPPSDYIEALRSISHFITDRKK